MLLVLLGAVGSAAYGCYPTTAPIQQLSIPIITILMLYLFPNHQLGRVSQGPYFLGGDISLVDITFSPMLERAAASLTYYKVMLMLCTQANRPPGSAVCDCWCAQPVHTNMLGGRVWGHTE